VRRIAGIALSLVAVAAVAATIGAGGGGPSTYRVDALFDNADYLVQGQQVKIAGAVVGDVTGLHVTRDHKARVEMEMQSGFAPFRSDASCEIRPESLIGEKFVQCNPGTPNGSVLNGDPPVVPLAGDHSPVDMDLVLSALRLPFRQRLSLLVDELGTGLAGRPADLNAAIRRANPALQEARKVLGILNSDRATLGRLIDASDRTLAELAAHRGDVASFIDRAATVSSAFADRQSDLGQSIHRLPPLLAQVQPASAELAGFASDARPVARDLRAAAGPVNELLGDLGPLTRAAHPTLVKLSELSATGLRTVRHTMPVARQLLPVAQELPPNTVLLRQLTESLRDAGMIEGLLKFVYFTTTSEARFDQTSHILPSYQILTTCNQYATKPVAGCSAHWPGSAADAGAQPTIPSAPTTRPAARGAPSGKRAGASAATPASAPAPAPAPAAAPPQAQAQQPAAPPTVVRQLLGYLLAP
jgi:phospholipid/cholesterol/gamma-HCH transport system substrate-binding protein